MRKFSVWISEAVLLAKILSCAQEMSLQKWVMFLE